MFKKKAFTLIELLVVIAAIAILATLIAVSISSFRANSRDGVRLLDVKQMAIALDYYRDDHGSYPECSTCDYQSGWNNCLAIALEPYMQNLPQDPTFELPCSYCYFSNLDNAVLHYPIDYNSFDSSHFTLDFIGQSVIKFSSEKEIHDLDNIILVSTSDGVYNYHLILR